VKFVAVAALTLLLAVPALADADPPARCHSADGQPKIDACTAAIASGTVTGNDLAALYTQRALGYVTLRQYDAAVADLKIAIGIAPDVGDAYVAIADIYEIRKQFDLSIPLWDHMVENWPKLSVVYGFRCRARARWGEQLDLAMDDCNTALRIAALHSQPTAHAEMYVDRAMLYYRLAKYDLAVADCDVSVGLNPHSAAAYYMRALAKKKAGDATSDADFGSAKDIESAVAEPFDRYGLTP